MPSPPVTTQRLTCSGQVASLLTKMAHWGVQMASLSCTNCPVCQSRKPRSAESKKPKKATTSWDRVTLTSSSPPASTGRRNPKSTKTKSERGWRRRRPASGYGQVLISSRNRTNLTVSPLFFYEDYLVHPSLRHWVSEGWGLSLFSESVLHICCGPVSKSPVQNCCFSSAKLQVNHIATLSWWPVVHEVSQSDH